ncbi:hypothetical protein ABK040_012861 [Willaertia magna]
MSQIFIGRSNPYLSQILNHEFELKPLMKEQITDHSRPKLYFPSNNFLENKISMEHFFQNNNNFTSNDSNNDTNYLIEYSEIEGAKIAVAIPKYWNKGLIIHCHGHRAVGIGLKADLYYNNMPESFNKFLQEGFMIAMTSYRREGIILKDAIKDVNNLRNYIIDKFGKLECCILEGRSMGGAIVTYISEIHSDLYDGAVCIGAALNVDQKDESLPHLSFQFKPKFPLLYLMNVSELGKVEDYIEQSKQLANTQHLSNDFSEGEVIVPSLWTVSREGHNSVSEIERYGAIQNLIYWIKFKTHITTRYLDYTHPIPIPESQLIFVENDRGAWCKINHLGIHGNFGINVTIEDLQKLDICEGKYFTMHIMTKGNGVKTISVALGTFPFIKQSDIEFVCFINPVNNYSIIHLNSYKFHNEAFKLGVNIGDKVFIEKWRQLPKPPKSNN